jgi:hypothetical protein
MRQKKHQSRRKDILFILISSFVVVVAWIGFNIYHIYITSTISEEVQVQLVPIDGQFDIETIQNLKSRNKVVPAFEKQETASQSPTIPTPTIMTAIDVPASSESSRFAPTDSPINRVGQ